jgi:non-ribosomal peptide synthetase component F
MLSAYSNQKDIVIGTVVANREYGEISETIGFFVNTLAMRQEVDVEGDIIDLIEQVGESVQKAQLNQDIPFEMLVSELGVEKDPSRHPIFQTIFSLQISGEIQENELSTIFTNPDQALNESGYKIAKFDLSLSILESGKIISGNFNYATSLFEKETVESYIETYKEIINQIVGLHAEGELDEIEYQEA